MSRIVKLGTLQVVVAMVLISVPPLMAQEASVGEAAPVPAQILAGKRVFISNGGVDVAYYSAFKDAAGADQPYNQFYAAMKNWGRYELVADPSSADLVFDIRITTLPDQTPECRLAILDVKTHFKLWTIAEPVKNANLRKTYDKNLSTALSALIGDLTKLTSRPVAAAGSPKQ